MPQYNSPQIQQSYPPPTHTAGPIRSIGGGTKNTKASQKTNYGKRLGSYRSSADSYNLAKQAFMNGLNQQVKSSGQAYRPPTQTTNPPKLDLSNAAMRKQGGKRLNGQS